VMAYQEKVVFNIHNNKVFEFGLLSYVNGSVSKLFAFTYDSKVFTTGLDHMSKDTRVDNVGGNKAIRTMFTVLGFKAPGNFDQQPLVFANFNQQTFITPSTSVRKPRSDVKITDFILGLRASRFVENP
nr:hypothetical protein [Tanacetum cinerariifolium]